MIYFVDVYVKDELSSCFQNICQALRNNFQFILEIFLRLGQGKVTKSIRHRVLQMFVSKFLSIVVAKFYARINKEIFVNNNNNLRNADAHSFA